MKITPETKIEYQLLRHGFNVVRFTYLTTYAANRSIIVAHTLQGQRFVFILEDDTLTFKG